MPYCPYCGSEVLNGSNFCPSCGKNLNEPNKSEEATSSFESSGNTYQVHGLLDSRLW